MLTMLLNTSSSVEHVLFEVSLYIPSSGAPLFLISFTNIELLFLSNPGTAHALSTLYSPIWCKPMPTRSINIIRCVSMTEKSSGVRAANITDLHIAMVRDDFTIQTELNIC